MLNRTETGRNLRSMGFSSYTGIRTLGEARTKTTFWGTEAILLWWKTAVNRKMCVVTKSEHGAAAGVILFFTCASAVIAPLAMAAVSDAIGHARYGFVLATGFAALLFVGSVLNWCFNPTSAVLEQLDHTEYQQV